MASPVDSDLPDSGELVTDALAVSQVRSQLDLLWLP
jgi:hypothetical protein